MTQHIATRGADFSDSINDQADNYKSPEDVLDGKDISKMNLVSSLLKDST